jgi:hypothetical protein
MKCLLTCIVLVASITQALAINCPAQPHDYMADIVPIRAQEKVLRSKIDNVTDSATTLRYIREDEALDERISNIAKTMNECDAIGQSILKDLKN